MPVRTWLTDLVALLLASAALVAHAESANEGELKAAYLLNFSMFVEWPTWDRQKFTICQYGADSLGAGAEALERRAIRGKAIAVRIVSGTDFADCDVLYLSATNKARLRDIARGLRGSRVLTVSDAEGAVRDGIVIGLELQGRKMVFQVNAAEAKRNALVISAKLLSLAQSIQDSP